MTISIFWVGVVIVIFLMLIGLLVSKDEQGCFGCGIVLVGLSVIVGMIIGRLLQ